MLKENIKRIRENNKISQRELARKIGMSGQMISKIERGESAPSLETLDKIATALNVTKNDLLGDSEKERTKSILQTKEGEEIKKNSRKYIDERDNFLTEFIRNEYKNSLEENTEIDENTLYAIIKLSSLELEPYITSIIKIKLESHLIKYMKMKKI